jgi:hypothetical protein
MPASFCVTNGRRIAGESLPQQFAIHAASGAKRDMRQTTPSMILAAPAEGFGEHELTGKRCNVEPGVRSFGDTLMLTAGEAQR